MDTDQALCLSVLFVEDHQAFREVTADALTHAGHAVTALESAEDLIEQPAAIHWDVAILDLNLPGEDGFSLSARLRNSYPGLGIIFLTARNELQDRVRGYATGADIYLPKPVALQELLAALQALGRRLRPASIAPEQAVRHWSLLAAARTLVDPDGRRLALSEAEAKLLRALILAPENYAEYWQLISFLGWGDTDGAKERLEVLTSRLRKKLRDHQPNQPGIVTVRGQGLRLALPCLMY